MNRRQFAALAFAGAPMAFGQGQTASPSAPKPAPLSVDEVAEVMDDAHWVLVDTRPSDAYHGWKLDGVERGGHLPGAVDFPATWLDRNHKDKEEILRAARQAKGITPERHLVLYSTRQEDRARVASYLRQAGFPHLYAFDSRAWANNSKRPLSRYPNYHLLVPPAVVKRLLEGERPETFEGAQRVKFAEVSWGEEKASYARGHVPGSFHVNTDDFEPPPKWTLGSPEVLGRFAAKYGFQADDTVILSSEDPTAS